VLAVSESLLFWLIAAAMTALALAFALPRLLTRRPPPVRAGRTAVHAAICRGELADLARQHAEQRLTDDEYAAARDEVERRLLAEADEDAPEPAVTGSATPSRGVALATAFALPALAFGLYALVGDPAALRGTPAPVPASATADGEGTASSRRDELVRHLERYPADGRGWVLLARADLDADRFGDAVASYRKALAASPRIAADPDVLCEYADALGMTQGGQLAGEPRELVMRALAKSPAHPKALEMAGSAAYERRDFAGAAAYWRRLLPQLPEGSQSQRELAAAIAGAERQTVVARGPEAPR
jgi:cytochrome c-type biogenesis protein CcmH